MFNNKVLSFLKIKMVALRVLGLLFFGLFNSGLAADSVCPDPTAVAPCVCSNVDGFPELYCILINNEDDLLRIFSADFPQPNVRSFKLAQSDITTISQNVFGNVSFQAVQLESAYLESVTESVFENSLNTLRYFRVSDSPFTVSSFPFSTLGEYSTLLEVMFKNNILASLPQISSNSIRAVRVLDNGLQTISNSSLSELLLLDVLTLNGNEINAIEEGAFASNQELRSIYLKDNGLKALRGTMLKNLKKLTYLSFENNLISKIDDDVFEDQASLTEIDLAANQLQTINSTIFTKCISLKALQLQNNVIDTVEPGSFSGTAISALDLSFNNLTRIQSGTFDGLSSVTLNIESNQINYIEANSFGNISNSQIHLESNYIDVLYEFWLEDLLERGNDVFLNGNPFSCGCEISWLFQNTVYPSRVIGQCPDGSYVSELDPDYYLTQCR